MLDGEEENGQQDHFKMTRTLEIIAKLAYAGNDNRIYLIDFIDIIIQIINSCIGYTYISRYTLEYLYQLSELGKLFLFFLTID